MSDHGLQAALPREMYVDETSWAREREAVLFRDWFCLGRVEDLGIAGPSAGDERHGRRRVGAHHQ